MKVKGLNGKSYFWRCKGIDWEGKSRSNLQKECKAILGLYWNGDVVAEEQNVPGTKMKFDFVNFSKKIVLEVSGGQHFTYNKHFHKNNIFEFVGSLGRDQKKRDFAEKNGFTFVEVKTPEELNRVLLELSKI